MSYCPKGSQQSDVAVVRGPYWPLFGLTRLRLKFTECKATTTRVPFPSALQDDAIPLKQSVNPSLLCSAARDKDKAAAVHCATPLGQTSYIPPPPTPPASAVCSLLVHRRSLYINIRRHFFLILPSSNQYFIYHAYEPVLFTEGISQKETLRCSPPPSPSSGAPSKMAPSTMSCRRGRSGSSSSTSSSLCLFSSL